MSYVEWIAAATDIPPQGARGKDGESGFGPQSSECGSPISDVGPQPSTGSSAGEISNDEGWGYQASWEVERARRIYRGRTVAMLRRYMRYSIETGRLPSLLGREFFRAK